MPPYSPPPGRATGRPTTGGKGLLSNATSGRGTHSRGVGVPSGGKGKGKSNAIPLRRQRYVHGSSMLDSDRKRDANIEYRS